MGMNASARLWYGVMTDTLGPLSNDEEFYDGETTVDGVNVHPVWGYDSPIGIGGTLAYSWWGDKDVVNLDGLDALRAAVDKFLDAHGIEGERNLYLLANYS